ncbi:MAG TPA: dTMP kinase [Thermoleophilia bacterium]|nr:dTMP kinase [Thermoleophilia bacterium]
MADVAPGGSAGACGGRSQREWRPPPADAALDESALAGLGSATRGVFITFEGLDGSGKSTQMDLLAGSLRAAGYEVVTTREPGGTPLGEAFRDILLDPGHSAMTARAEALLYSAARAQLVETVIRPALDEGRIVLCDRYLDSSLAYQGYGRGLQVEDVLTLNVWATECLFPDLTIVLMVDEVERANRASQAPDRLEAAGLSFFERAAEGYRRLAADHRHRIRLVDSVGAVNEVQARVRAAIDEELELFSRSS